ncbi:cob(I)yrinic acid a,c-diamide adenosyltransferase [Candidatus Beckwithbacteria bacterium]|nr:cob(I)yrinic acid a,c-diamide adenosyltransferase [Candidatus Beckwithbacteria bacterium]
MALVYLFTGNGKGKTSAALGIALRSVCASQKVAWIYWYKNENWYISEKKIGKFLPIDFYLLGKGFYITAEAKAKDKNLANCDKLDFADHQEAAQKALQKTKQILQAQKHDLLILDEIVNAVTDKLLDFAELENLIKNKKETHLILTGRNASKKLMQLCDLVSKIEKIKHPFDQQMPAVKGLDF